MNYKSEKEILAVIEKFESCSIERGTWGHPEHLIVAYHYASKNDFETALSKMRDGIFILLKSFKVDLTKEMPYHETLTVFWMRTIFEFAKDNSGFSVETINKMIEKFDKNYPGEFYTHEHLFSEEARAKFVEPDVKRIPSC
ncbi:MAG: hypothetical protein HKN25_10285 [Pyrinomonadaceae bacterium]|nr:hypothetical protein [Pyrinomonadaceae bacterium]